MRIIVLSDYPAEQLARRQAEREEKYARGLQEHADRLRVRQGEIDDLRGRRSLALVQGNYLKALGYTLGVQWGRYGMYLDRRRKPVREQPGAEDEILEKRP